MSRIDEALRRAGRTSQVIEPVGDNGIEVPPIELQQDVAAPAVEELRFESSPPAAVLFEPVAAPPGGQARPARDVPDERVEPAHGKLVTGAHIQPAAVEEYRKLAAALHQARAERDARVVMVASAVGGEGKTLTAANLSLTLSKSFQRSVLLIDTDLRRPRVHELFGIANDRGLNDGLQSDQDGKLALVDVSPRLTVLPAGRANPDPMGDLTSDRMRRVIGEAAAKFDWVVLDTPPIGLLPDANLLAEMVDMVVLVVGAGTTRLGSIQRALEVLGRKRIAGVVLNRVAESADAYAYHRYHTFQRASA